jgi:hypothetical protein
MLCELCESEEAYDFHHLIPRTNHSNKWFKKRYTRMEMAQGLEVCKDCHNSVHDLIPSEKEMGRHFNTLAKLKSHPKVREYLRWKKKRSIR